MRYLIDCSRWPVGQGIIKKRRRDAALTALYATIYDQLGAYGLRDTKHAWTVRSKFLAFQRDVEGKRLAPGKAWAFSVEITQGCVVSFHGMREP